MCIYIPVYLFIYVCVLRPLSSSHSALAASQWFVAPLHIIIIINIIDITIITIIIDDITDIADVVITALPRVAQSLRWRWGRRKIKRMKCREARWWVKGTYISVAAVLLTAFFFFESVHLVSSLDLVASLSTFVSFFSLNFSFVAVSLHPYFLFPSPVVQTYALREWREMVTRNKLIYWFIAPLTYSFGYEYIKKYTDIWIRVFFEWRKRKVAEEKKKCQWK